MLRRLFLASILAALIGTWCCSPVFAFGLWLGHSVDSMGLVSFLAISFGVSWLFLGLPTVLVWLLFRWVIDAFEVWYWNGQPPERSSSRDE